MNETSTITQDINNLIDSFNTVQEQAQYSLQIEVQAAGKTQVVLTDGGMVGTTYVGTVPHNLGYAPMFIVYARADGLNQYRLLPTIPVMDGGGATINYLTYAYSDGVNLNVAIRFFAPTVSFGRTNNGPFYSPGMTFDFTYFIMKSPIYAN